MILGMDIETRCNIFATVQLLFINKLLVDLIYFGTEVKPLWTTFNNSRVMFKDLTPPAFKDPDLRF